MAGLIFYTNPRSRGTTVRFMLEELGVPYESVILDYEGAMKTPGYLAINPMGLYGVADRLADAVRDARADSRADGLCGAFAGAACICAGPGDRCGIPVTSDYSAIAAKGITAEAVLNLAMSQLTAMVNIPQ